MADVPASHGARYGRPSGSGDHRDQPTRQQPRYQPGRYQPPVAPQQRSSGPYPPPGRRPRQDDGWDAPTQHVSSAYAGGRSAAAPARSQPVAPARGSVPPNPYSPVPPRPGYGPTETRISSRRSAAAEVAERAPERGVAGWMAVLVLIIIAGIGGGIDLINGSPVKTSFNISIVVGAVAAILLVRRSSMFAVVVAPPLVYFGASAVLLYARSDGLHDRKVLLDAAANWLVYGFPAIAGATAAVLIIAGIRLIAGR